MRGIKAPIKERFYSKIALPSSPDACWEWIGAKSPNGYGNFWAIGRQDKAHRVSYAIHNGEIPGGQDIDHLCRNRACVRPDHLEPCSRSINLRRGVRRTLQVVCKRGHPLSGLNVRHYTNSKGYHVRICRECERQKEDGQPNWKPGK